MALALVILSLGTGLGFLLAPLHPSAGYVAVTSMLAGPSAVGLWLRRHGVGEPVLDREGWRWLGAGAFLYLFSVSWSIELLMGMEYASGWEYPAYAVAFFVLVGTPWALGPEGRG